MHCLSWHDILKMHVVLVVDHVSSKLLCIFFESPSINAVSLFRSYDHNSLQIIWISIREVIDNAELIVVFCLFVMSNVCISTRRVL